MQKCYLIFSLNSLRLNNLVKGRDMNKYLIVVFISIFFIKNSSADINKEVSDLKNEFKQIKEIYENKIEALEAKIEKL